MTKNIIWRTFIRAINIVPSNFHSKGLWALFLSLLNSILELVGVGAMIPLITILLQQDPLATPLLSKIYLLFGLKSENQLIILFATVVLVIVILKNIVSLLIQRHQIKFSTSIFLAITEKINRRYFSMDFLSFKSFNSNDIYRTIYSIPAQFSNAIIIPLLNIASEGIVFLFIVVGLLIYDYRIVFVIVSIVTPFFFFFYNRVKKNIQEYGNQQNKLIPKIGKNLFQNIRGYVDLKIIGTQDYFFNEYQKLQEKMVSLQIKLIVHNLAPSKIIETSMILGVVILIIFGLTFVGDKKELSTILAIFVLAAYRIMPSINKIIGALINLKTYQYTLEQLEAIDQLKVSQQNSGESTNNIRFKHKICLNNVSFNYPNSKMSVIKNINLEISKNDIIGIIGQSGAGKTTLINLLLGFINPTSGNISVDNKTISTSNLISWRNLIGYVPQEINILDGSISQNIAFGVPLEMVNSTSLNQAIKKAGLSKLVDQLEQGIHTIIGENGSTLSGGQKQRLAISRALYFGANVLIFDEATSALDNETEKEITEAICSLSSESGITMIIIAHRLTTLKYCNKIIELKNGEIEESKEYHQIIKNAL